jgi:hypothetical protein
MAKGISDGRWSRDGDSGCWGVSLLPAPGADRARSNSQTREIGQLEGFLLGAQGWMRISWTG